MIDMIYESFDRSREEIEKDVYRSLDTFKAYELIHFRD